jgi:hypothetical protein
MERGGRIRKSDCIAGEYLLYSPERVNLSALPLALQAGPRNRTVKDTEMPNISIARLNELERKEAQLADLHKQKSCAWVGTAFGNALATIYASRPWDKWTPGEKQLLHAVCGDAVTALELYKSLLPRS